MAPRDGGFVLPDVPPLNRDEHPDLALEALSLAAAYGTDGLQGRFPMGVYPHLSGYTGRGWLIGFDDAAYYWERHGVRNPDPGFAAAGLESNLEHWESLREAIAYLGFAPELLWHGDGRYAVDPVLAAPFVAAARTVDGPQLRREVVEQLTARRRPVVCFLHSPQIPIVDGALLTGFEARGEVVLGRSPHQEAGDGHFRLADWERDVVAVLGLGPQAPPEAAPHPCYTAIGNALRYSASRRCGTRHYGLAAYDAWEAALLDEAGLAGADDHTVSRRLLYHSGVAGNTACQKAFTAFPDYWHAVPSMGVISGLLQQAVAGPQIIHGLMWDLWQVVGGYWRGAGTGAGPYRQAWSGPAEVQRFREREVRERAVAVIRRARRIDAQALDLLREAQAEWDRCRGQGGSHPCPCWDAPCTRVGR